MTEESNQHKTLPKLDAEEIRVLGALMEKSRTTPEYYPMTLNAITAACNQKSSRNPVVNYEEQTVNLCLDRLKVKGFVTTVIGGSSRVIKYRHTIALNYEFTPDEIAVLCLLFLRGPLTPGEINSNSARLYEFDDLAEVHAVMNKLNDAETPFIRQLERLPGQKEARYMHLFGEDAVLNSYRNESALNANISNQPEFEERLNKVETELNELRAQFEKLLKELMG